MARIERRDPLTDEAARRAREAVLQRLQVPPALRGTVTAVVDGRLVIEGHVPAARVREALALAGPGAPPALVLAQHRMTDRPETYTAWAPGGEARELAADRPLGEYVASLARPPSEGGRRLSGELLLATVVAAGLLDGVNPCAFAVILFLVAFLYAIRKIRADVWRVGFTFIASVVVTTFLIGVGLLGALTALGQPHLIGQIGGGLLILLGMMEMRSAVASAGSRGLSMAPAVWERVKGWVTRATVPSAIVAGGLVGICTLPCAGGIYLATLGLVAGSATFSRGLGFLAAYNLASAVPLVAVLALVGNREFARRAAQWERLRAPRLRGAFGFLMLVLGVGALLWFGR